MRMYHFSFTSWVNWKSQNLKVRKNFFKRFEGGNGLYFHLCSSHLVIAQLVSFFSGCPLDWITPHTHRELSVFCSLSVFLIYVGAYILLAIVMWRVYSLHFDEYLLFSFCRFRVFFPFSPSVIGLVMTTVVSCLPRNSLIFPNIPDHKNISRIGE